MTEKNRLTRDYAKLKCLLEEQETFPTVFTHKFIGRNSDGFTRGVTAWEARFPKARQTIARKSAGDGHLALTYEFDAANADEIIALLEATAEIEDVLVIL